MATLLDIMHSGSVNGYQLLCDAHTVLEKYRGILLQFYFNFSLLSFSALYFVFLSLYSNSAFSFLEFCQYFVLTMQQDSRVSLMIP